MVCDPYWNKTVLACHFDGANGSTTFTDEKGNTLTPNGNVQISTAQSKFGGASAYFDGTNSVLQISASSDFNLYGVDSTIDGWLYLAGTGDRFICGYNNATTDFWDLRAISTGALMFRPNGDGSALTSTVTIPNGVWTHFAVVTESGNSTIYIGGVAAGTIAGGVTTANGSYVLSIGRNLYGSGYDYWYNGYIDDLRITKAPRYTEAFAPPTATFLHNQCAISGNVKDANSANAKRLVRVLRRDSLEVIGIGQSNATTGDYSIPVDYTGECTVISNDVMGDDDSSSNVSLALRMVGANNTTTFTDDKGHSTTANGGVKISAGVAPYGRSAAQFNGAGAYIACTYSTDYEVGSGDFTVEFWFKVPDVSGQKTMFAFTGDFHYGIFLNGNRMNCFASSNGSGWDIISGDTGGNYGMGYKDVTANVWHHFAWVRNGSTWTMWLDGKVDRRLLGVSGTVVSRNEALNIGRWGHNGYWMRGFIKDFRLTKGIARYATAFAPPLPDFLTVLGGTENAVVLDRLIHA